jgi:hypothetical protein
VPDRQKHSSNAARFSPFPFHQYRQNMPDPPSVIYRSFNSFILKKNHVFISPRLIRARSG